jgi:hypothetical protein
MSVQHMVEHTGEGNVDYGKARVHREQVSSQVHGQSLGEAPFKIITHCNGSTLTRVQPSRAQPTRQQRVTGTERVSSAPPSATVDTT